MSKEKFIEAINKSYTTTLPTIYLGAGVYNGEIIAEGLTITLSFVVNKTVNEVNGIVPAYTVFGIVGAIVK